MSKLKLNVLESIDGTFQINVKDLLNGVANIKRFGAVGDGVNIDGPFIQQALDSGAKSVYIPQGTWLLDDDLIVPEGVELYGCGNSSVLRMVGQDTHGRNSALFTKYSGVNINASPAMVMLMGSNSKAHDFMCDGNGLNNYVLVGGFADYVDETNHYGYCGVRIGKILNRTPSDPMTFIENSHCYRVTVKLTAWGGITIAGGGYRQDTSFSITGDENLIGAAYCSIRNNTTINTFSNNIATFSAKHCVIDGNIIVNNVHKGIATYVRCRDILISNNVYTYDETTDVSWRGGVDVAGNRERELGTRSDAIAIGHSDYDTLMENIQVVDNKLDGAGLIRNGISVFSATKQVTISGNHITGFISPLSLGVSSRLNITGNTTAAASYTTTSFTPGTQYIGVDVQFSARSIETTKVRPAPICVMSITGNHFTGGTGTNNIRGNDWSVWNALDAGLQANFSGNTYDTQTLSAIGAIPAIHASLNTNPTSINPSAIHFESEKYVTSTGYTTDGSILFDSNRLWTFIWPLRVRFSFTPNPIGGTTAGTATITSSAGTFVVDKNSVNFNLEVGWSAHTGTGNLRITGMPITSRSTVNGGIPSSFSTHFSGLTYTGQAVAVIMNSSATIDLYGLTSGGGLTNIAMDTSVNVIRISGRYSI